MKSARFEGTREEWARVGGVVVYMASRMRYNEARLGLDMEQILGEKGGARGRERKRRYIALAVIEARVGSSGPL